MDSQQIQELRRRLDFHNQHGLTIEFPHQVEAHQAVVQDLAKMRQPDDFWSLMVMATGSGKSFTAGKEIKAFNTPAGARSPVWDQPVVVVTSRVALTNQLKESFVSLAGIDPSKVGIYSTASKARSHLEKPVLIVPYPTFLSLSRSKVITPESRPLLILDEAHGAIGANVAKEIRDHWVGKSYVQCWTATDKLPNKTVAQVLFDSRTPQGVDDATYRLTLKQAAERGIVAPIKSMVLETEFTPGVKPNLAGNFSEKDIAKIVGQKGRMEALIRLCHDDYADKFGVNFSGMRTVIFTPQVQHAEDVAREFNRIYGPGYAVVVSGDTKPREMDLKQPDSIVSRFTRGNRALGDPKIIINAKYIEEGADIPAAELIVEEVPTFSERVATQRVGRGARKWSGNPGKTTYSVVMLDKGQTGAALIGEMEGWELKPKEFVFPVATPSAKSGPPLPPGYPDIPVHVVADVREIAEFGRRRLDEAGDTQRPKPSGFWSSEELGQSIKLAKPRVDDEQSVARRIMKSLRDQLELGPLARYRNVSVPREAIVEYDSPGGTAYAIRQEEGTAIIDELTREREKPPAFWSGKELGEAIIEADPEIKTPPQALGSRIISTIREQLQAQGTSTFREISVNADAIEEYDYNGATGYAIRMKEGKSIADSYLAKQEKPPGYLSGGELGDAIRKLSPSLDPAIGYDILSKLRRQLKSSPIATYRKVEVPEDAIVGYRYFGRQAYALRKAECDQLLNTFESTPEQPSRNKPPAGYWSSNQFGDAIAQLKPGINAKSMGSRIINALRSKLADSEEIQYKGIHVGRDALVAYEYNGLPSTAIRQKEADALAQAIATTKLVPSDGFVTGASLSKAIEEVRPDVEDVGTLGNLIIGRIRTQLKVSNTANFKNVSIVQEAIDEYEGPNGKPAYALRQAEADALVAAYVSDDKAKFGIKPKRLKPGGDDLKRTGFTPDRS